ncbi:MAG: bis(5'-nucleosidyl)-tetraphosphatase [Candidatus Paceibacteria bacterium]|jgi:bis(5'-nucleosidyl)-tetraphosphatase
MQSKTDYSYGVIPIRRVDDSWEVFLIHQFSKIGNNSYWIFPKGHPEGKETMKQTALRELKEETGMTPETLLAEPVFNLEYSFVFDGVKINKTVKFLVGIMTDLSFELDGIEVKEAAWYSLEDAAKRLDYQDTKQLFQEVRLFLKAFTLE